MYSQLTLNGDGVVLLLIVVVVDVVVVELVITSTFVLSLSDVTPLQIELLVRPVSLLMD